MAEREFLLFKNLANPGTRSITPDTLLKHLESVREKGYADLSASSLGAAIFETLKFEASDSPYGVRVFVAQNIMAQAMHDGGYAMFAGKEAAEFRARGASLERKYGSVRYKAKKHLGLLKERALRAGGVAGMSDEYFMARREGLHENEAVERLALQSECMKNVSLVAADMHEAFADAGLDEIIELTELNHIMSGRKNGTGINATFEDYRIRAYCNTLQQAIHKLWFGAADPRFRPLSADELSGIAADATYDL